MDGNPSLLGILVLDSEYQNQTVQTNLPAIHMKNEQIDFAPIWRHGLRNSKRAGVVLQSRVTDSLCEDLAFMLGSSMRNHQCCNETEKTLSHTCRQSRFPCVNKRHRE